MSGIIPNNRNAARIDGHLRRTLMTANSRGGEIAAAGQARLGPAIAEIDAALASRQPALDAEAIARTNVATEEHRSKVLIGAIRDAMWNALERPRHNRHLAQVFPDGVATYTDEDPLRLPVFINVLKSRITACAAPLLKDEQRAAWVAQLEDARKALDEVLEVHRPTEALASVTEATYRSAVRRGHEQLRMFKRDLENLGLSRAQIFDIIPDGAPAVKASKPDVKTDGKSEGRAEGTTTPTDATGSSANDSAPSPANPHSSSKAA